MSKDQHRFWKDQPVSQKSIISLTRVNEPIDPPKDAEKDVKPNPYTLPKGYEWITVDVNDDVQLKKVYDLLCSNYVEDHDSTFRFNYSIPFLRWALTPPGYYQDWHIGVVISTTREFVGFITGIPVNIRIYDKIMKMAEINFLCVCKRLRTKRLAPVLIKEIHRRVNRLNIWQAIYTAGISLPGLICKCRYYHRSLNPKKLIEVEFAHLKRNVSLALTKRAYKLPDTTCIPGFRLMKIDDAEQVFLLFNQYMERYDLTIHFSKEEIIHWFLKKEKVVYSYVVEDPESKKIFDFCSYYVLPSTVLNHPVHKSVDAAYSYYNISTKTPLVDLMKDALISAKNLGLDVFNCLDLMENSTFIEPLKFGSGDGNLHYYLFNWKCNSIDQKKLGMVLL